MKRARRDVALVTLSALDALACAAGVFLLLLVVLMPYYRNSFDGKAALEGLRASVEASAAELEDLKERIAEESERSAALLSEAERISAEAASLEARPVPRPDPRPPTPPGGERVVEALDLVFVVDTTASMGAVLEQMSRSMASIVRILERLVPSVRVGVVAYRDYDAEPPLIRSLPPVETRTGLPEILAFVASLRPSRVSSGSLPEAVLFGLQHATQLPFRPEARQAVVVIGDASAHPHELRQTFDLVGRFVAGSPRRSVSGLFVSTRSSRRFGDADRGFFVRLAEAGKGHFNDHAASMTESILLSLVVE
jgi:hypothetical protein